MIADMKSHIAELERERDEARALLAETSAELHRYNGYATRIAELERELAALTAALEDAVEVMEWAEARGAVVFPDTYRDILSTARAALYKSSEVEGVRGEPAKNSDEGRADPEKLVEKMLKQFEEEWLYALTVYEQRLVKHALRLALVGRRAT